MISDLKRAIFVYHEIFFVVFITYLGSLDALNYEFAKKYYISVALCVCVSLCRTVQLMRLIIFEPRSHRYRKLQSKTLTSYAAQGRLLVKWVCKLSC